MQMDFWKQKDLKWRNLCPEGQSHDWRAGCYNDPFWCPEGGELNSSTGKCSGPWRECPDGEMFDWDSNNCITDENWCPGGEIRVWEEKGGSRCDTDPRACASNQIYNWRDQKCMDHSCDGLDEWVDRDSGKCFPNPMCDW